MKTRILGPERFTVSAIGFGCMGLSQGYGPANDADSLATLRRAFELGVTFWDTAQSYGGGHNERLLARALEGRRDQVQLATKFGIVRTADGVSLDGRPAHVPRYCEASLERLATDYIDLYYLHRVDPRVPIEESIGAMARLVEQGKVRYLGVSECDAAQLERAASVHPITALQCEWSLWWREPEDDVIPMARRLGVALVPYSPLGRGFLTGALPESFGAGDFRSGDERFKGSAEKRNLDVLNKLEQVAVGLGLSLPELMLAWLLAQGSDVVPIPGTRRADRLAQNARAADAALSAADLAAINAVAGRGAWAGNRQSFAAYHTERRAS